MATNKKSGMQSNPLARRSTPKASGPGTGSVITALQAQTAPQAIPLDDIAYHPDNPPERVTDIDQLTDSIRQVGVITPITVVAREAFVAVRPDLADHPALEGREWVTLAGHRRHAASVRAGKSEVPAYIRREDIAALVDTAILHENLHRLEISPIVEARSYQHAMERQGLSQRQLAAHAALPQSQISKRLALLTLPESLQARITSGDLALGDAAAIAATDPEVRHLVAELIEQAGTSQDTPRLLRQAEAQVARAARERAASERAQAEGATPLLDTNSWSWAEEQQRRLTSKAEISKARKAGTLAVAPASRSEDPEEVRFYTTAPASTPPQSTREEAERAEAREQKTARRARRAHLLERATRPPAAAKMHEAVISTVLNGLNLNAEVAKIAMPLTYAAELTTTDPSSPANGWDWRREIPSLTGKDALHAAWLISLADHEYAASYTHSTWGPRQVDYLEQLIATGYSPTPWESERLTHARARA